MMKLAFRVVLSMGMALGLGCGGVEPTPDSVEQGAPPADEVTAQGHGCPRNGYGCVAYCQSQGHRQGRCGGSGYQECTCSKN